MAFKLANAIARLRSEFLMKNCLIVYFLFLGISHANANSDKWHYLDPLRPSDSYTIQEGPDQFQINDVIIPANLCKKEEPYICIRSQEFNFYVPKNLAGSSSSWEVDGVKYKASLNKRVELLGLIDEFYLIRKDSSAKTIFIYSKIRGLIGMGGYSGSSSRLFLSIRNCGFGASDSCR